MTIDTPHSASGSPAAKPGFAPIRVWDLPTRLFHWGLVALVIAMVWTGWQGKLDLHMSLGQVVLSLVLFRLIWGFAGNRYARFTDFVAGPMAGLRYLGTLFGRPGPKYIGHNPVGGYAVLAMLGLLALLLLVGWQTRWAALGIAVFTLVITFIFHNFWGVPAEQVMQQQQAFFKNIAVVGGLYAFVAFGAGAWSLDAKLRRA